VNKLNRILVGVLGFQVALVLLFHLVGDDTSIGSFEPLVAGLAKDKLERVRIFDATAPDQSGAAEKKDDAAKKDKNAPAVDLVKKGEAWVLASHFDYPVDADKVTDLVGKIEGLRSRGAIASGKARQKQLEVADDSYQRKVVITAGGKDVTLYLGASAGSRQSSVRLAGQEEVHGVLGLTAFGVSAQPSGWAEGAYVDVPAERIATLDLVNANGTFHFERAASGNGWQVSHNGQPITPPAGMELNKSEIDKVVTRASKISMAEPGDPKRAIDKPLATVTLRLLPEHEGAGAADAGAAEQVSTIDENQDRVIEIAASDKKDRYYVREKGKPTAILVEALSITDLAEITRDRLQKKIEEKKPEAGPGEMPMEGLPPGLDPAMMGNP
jgi:hypothetical protein